MPFFNDPTSQIPDIGDSGCPPGYQRVGDHCVNSLNGEIFKVTFTSGYDFIYYENAGELIGKYKLSGNNIPFQDQYLLTQGEEISNAAPYFGQNINVVDLDMFVLEDPVQVLTDHEAALFFEILHVDGGANPGTVEILHPLFTDPTVSSFPAVINTFYMGEFHLLTNSLKSIKRFNCNYQILQNLAEQANWAFGRSGAPALPTSFQTDDASSFLKFYLGYTRVPNTDRPSDLDTRTIYPSIQNPISATEWLNWQTLNTTCSSYLQVWNGSIPRNTFETNNPQDGTFVMQTKVNINTTNLTTWFNAAFDSSLYPIDSISNHKQMKYQIIVYPASIYMYPGKNPTPNDLISPIPNFVNNTLTELVFNMPKNYKSDGNIQWKVEFYNSKIDTSPLFVSSSWAADTNYEPVAWSELDGSTAAQYVTISDGTPTDDNLYDPANGSDAIDAIRIAYTLSPECLLALQGKSDIIFKIKQIDGTLIEPYLNN